MAGCLFLVFTVVAFFLIAPENALFGIADVPLDDISFHKAIETWFENFDTSPYGDIEDWNTSGVTNMSFAFKDIDDINFRTNNLSGWDVSSVTSMAGIFQNAERFNGDLSGWNVSQVTDLSKAFSGAVMWNQPLVDWDVRYISTLSSSSTFFFHCRPYFSLLLFLIPPPPLVPPLVPLPTFPTHFIVVWASSGIIHSKTGTLQARLIWRYIYISILSSSSTFLFFILVHTFLFSFFSFLLLLLLLLFLLFFFPLIVFFLLLGDVLNNGKV